LSFKKEAEKFLAPDHQLSSLPFQHAADILTLLAVPSNELERRGHIFRFSSLVLGDKTARERRHSGADGARKP
jgi:hypothetical protein